MKKLLLLAVLVTLSCLAQALAAEAVTDKTDDALPAKAAPTKLPAVDSCKCQPEKPVALSTPSTAASFLDAAEIRRITERLQEKIDKKFELLLQQQLDQEAVKLLP